MLMKILDIMRRHWALTLLSVVIAIWLGNSLFDVWIERSTFACNQPPEGIIRFTLSSGRDDGRLYEWQGKTFHQVGTTPIGKEMVMPYAEESYDNPTIWRTAVQGINRQAGGSGSLLRTLYAISLDRKWFVAALGPEFDLPDRVAFLNPGTSKLLRTVDFHGAINALA